MKRILLLMILNCFAAVGFAQTTYYWVGGSTSATLGGTNWSLTPGGTAITRPAATDDILIFDNVTVDFVTSSVNAGKLLLQNGANVSFARNSATGTSTFALNGAGGEALNISGGSKLRLIDGAGGSFVLSLASGTTSFVSNAEIYIQGAASQRIAVPNTSTLTFSNLAKCYVNVVATYPFSTSSVSGINAVIFQTGTSLVFQGGRNPFGEHASNFVVDMRDGSTFIVENNSAASILKDRWMKNVTIRNNVDLSMGSDNFSNINDLTIENGSTFQIRGTGPSPISGNIVNNGTLMVNATGSSNLLMIGHSPQSISGTGVFNLGALSVAEDADVTLNTSVNLAGSLISYIYGTLNVQGNQLKTNGVAANTGRIQFRPLTNNSTSAAVVTAGSNVINFVSNVDFTALGAAPGVLISGSNLEPNTYVVNTSSGGNGSITLSKPAISSGTSVTVLGTSGTLVTSSVNGVDGSFDINAEGSLTLSSGTNVIFNGTTTLPFPANTGSQLGNVTFNASATTNKDVTINGKLTLNNARLTVDEGHVVTMGSASSFDGTLDGSSYVVTAVNTTSAGVGKLRLTDVASAKLIPVGTVMNYTPVTLNPTSASSFDVNVFGGATVEATPNGTALTILQKLKLVNAIWNINRTSGTGDVEVTLGWDNVLEGAEFSNFVNAQIGVAGHNGSTYGTFAGSGNAAANTATFTTSTFSPFIVGEANTTLPLTLINFVAKESLNSVKLTWQTTSEVNLKNYVLQHRTTNGFQDIYSVAANNKAGVFNYNYTHLNPVSGANYYRLVGVDLDGTTYPSEIKVVNVSLANGVTVYPNPVSQKNINISGVAKGDVIKLMNIQGQVMATKTANGSLTEVIDVQNIQTGTYILSIENEGKITSTKKVIKI